ncbi:hypothetical protein [Dokdonia pacifica]|nr:hypothetical protein [Dokdonia pacifica]
MVLIRRYYKLIFKSPVVNAIKRLSLGYVNGNGAFHVSHDMLDLNISKYLLVVYFILMLMTTFNIIFPKACKSEHHSMFKYIRWCNIAIIVVLAITDCIEQCAFVESSIVEVILEIAIEIAHPAFV